MKNTITCIWIALTAASVANPTDLSFSKFSGSEITPSPACISVAATGEVYVGVDLLGSLGKGPGKGSVVRLVDKDHDGKADSHTVFAMIDNPRGLIAMGDKLYVLHTVIPADTGILTGMHLSVLEDKNQDGVADGPPQPLVKDISVSKHNLDRGADHTTNGIRMGIDGWIYIAVGDFGFVDATGTDGTKLTMLGGGIVRVRPDGSGMEVYTHGTRNVYDVAIDPQLNLFTRENTNDGGGWNVRFSHHVQSGQYGYPILFMNFTDEILPALEDLGGGSGTGALFLDEPGWSEKYNRQPMMADWGRNQIFIHRLNPDGPSFTQKAEEFIGISQPADLDVDGSGRIYIAAWEGAGYKGNPQRGFVQRVVPQGWTHKAFPDLTKLDPAALAKGLDSPSATARLASQQEILTRNDNDTAGLVLALAQDAAKPAYHRIAAIFTYKQLLGAKANPALLALAKDEAVSEFAMRALTDRLTELDGVPLEPFLDALKNGSPRLKAVAAVSLGRIGKMEAAEALLAVANLPGLPKGAVSAPKPPLFEPPPGANPDIALHATPNSPTIIPHLAVHSLVRLKAVDACLAALDGSQRSGALWALRLMHKPAVVDGLGDKLASGGDAGLKDQILASLSRLYHRETPYDGSWWWGTKPDTRGPYYKPMKWEKSAEIEKIFRTAFESSDDAGKTRITALSNLNRMSLEGIGEVEKSKDTSAKTIGQISIEDVMLNLDKMKGNPAKGGEILKAQACIACHSIREGDPKRGPDLNQIGYRLDREAIAEAILKPDAGIAVSWVDVTLKDATVIQGTLVEKTDAQVIVRDIAGVPHTHKAADVAQVKTSVSTVMGPHLLDSLTMPQFTDVIAYLHSLK